MSEWALPLTTLLLGAALAYVAASVQAKRAARREHRLAYLLDAYRSMERVSNREGPLTGEDARQMERAVADVYLLGTDEQQALVSEQIDELAKHKTMSSGQLLTSLRRDLRKELGLGPGSHDARFLRFTD